MKTQLIVIASQNTAKIQEMRQLLAGLPLQVASAGESDFSDNIVEDGGSFEANARLKAEIVSAALECWALADDSGIEVDFLSGAPGVDSAIFAGVHGDDAANNAKLLALLAGVPPEQRTARFISVIALATPNGATVTFSGVCEGFILNEPRGKSGFGYDPLFIPIGESESFGEMTPIAKNAISHRSIAMGKLRDYLKQTITIV